MLKRSAKYTGLIFGEGRSDIKFLTNLLELGKLKKYHLSKWEFNFDNAKGCSAKDILFECKKAVRGYSYHLVLCFIDLDDLKHDFPQLWKEKKQLLENNYSKFKIIWQKENLEDELKKCLGKNFLNEKKGALNKIAVKNITKFINSSYYNRIKKIIKDREKELEVVQ